ncbi:MAG: phage tail tape measure protein [Pseudomonadota bacterium]
MTHSVRDARRGGRDISRSFERSARSVDVLNNSLVRSRTSMLALGAAAGLALTSATRLIAGFEQAMSTVRAVTGATEKQFQALTERARELGATTRFTASEAAQGMIELARAGFTVDEVLGSVEGTLKLAQAGGLGLGRAAEITSNTLRAMQLDVSETARVVDVLAAAANSANTDVTRLGDGLSFVAPISAGLGVSLEDTVGALQALADAGFRGERGGTALRKIMIRLENQSKQGREILASYGLSMDEVSVSANGLIPVLRKLSAAGIGVGEQNILFGDRGGPGFGILQSSVEKIEQASLALENAAGAADDVATIMDDNLNGALKRANSALQELIIALGDTGPTQALESALNGLAGLLNVAAENADVLAIAIVALSARALLPLAKTAAVAAATALIRLNALISLSVLAFGRLGGAVAIAGSAMTALAGPTAVIAAAAAAYLLLARNSKSAAEQLVDFEGTMSRISETNKEIQDDTKKLEQLTDRLAQSIANQGTAAELTARQEIDAVTKRINKNKELIAVYESLARSQLASLNAELENQRSELARRLDNQLTGGLGGFGVEQLDSAREQFLDMVRAQQDAGGELSAFSRGTLEMVAELERLEVQAAAAREAVDALKVSASNPVGGSSDFVFEDGEGFGDLGGDDNERDFTGLDLARSQALRDLEIAEARRNTVRIQQLETELKILERMEEILSGNNSISQSDAFAQARDEVRRLRVEEGRSGALFNTDPFDGDNLVADAPKPQDVAEQQEQFRRTFKDAFRTAILDEDVGAAVRSVFADQAARGLDEALNDLADQIFQLFSNVFSSSGPGGIFDGIGDFFAGNLASGGSARAGRRYLIGERGPEMFIPSTDGHVVSNEDLRANGRTGAMSGGGARIRMGDINVYGDPSERTLKIVQDAMSQQARQLPSMIDQRVQESSARGRYA